MRTPSRVTITAARSALPLAVTTCQSPHAESGSARHSPPVANATAAFGLPVTSAPISPAANGKANGARSSRTRPMRIASAGSGASSRPAAVRWK